MVGVAQYARLGEADYFADVGMSVFSVFSSWLSDENFDSTDLESLLKSRDYGKIYIMLGLNEHGYAYDKLMDQYATDVARIRELQPEARIYLLKIYGVSRSMEAYDSTFSPRHLTEINDGIEAMADNEFVFCLDPRPLFEDEEGYILDEVSGDGVHPYGKYAAVFSQWLCEQTK